MLQFIFPWNKDGVLHSDSHKNLHSNSIFRTSLSFDTILPSQKKSIHQKTSLYKIQIFSSSEPIICFWENQIRKILGLDSFILHIYLSIGSKTIKL